MKALESTEDDAIFEGLSGGSRCVAEEYPDFLERFDTWWTSQREEK